MLVFVNKIENLNNQETVKSSYFTSIGGILLNYFSGILFKYYLQPSEGANVPIPIPEVFSALALIPIVT